MLSGSSRFFAITGIALTILLCGCRPTAPTGTHRSGGVTYSFPNTTVDHYEDMNGDLVVKTNAYTFKTKNQALFLNDKPFGTVKSGDTVTVKETGTVFVNDVQRDPQ